MCISFLSSGQVTVKKKCRKKLSAFPRLQSSKIALNKQASGSPMTNISVNCAFFLIQSSLCFHSQRPLCFN